MYCKMEPPDQLNIDDYETNALIGRLIEVQEKHMPGFRERFLNYEIFHETQKEIYVSRCDQSTRVMQFNFLTYPNELS